MEINASGKASDVAGALVAPPADAKASRPVGDLAAVTAAVEALLNESGVAPSDDVDVHFAVGVEGGWAVLRVARVVNEE